MTWVAHLPATNVDRTGFAVIRSRKLPTGPTGLSLVNASDSRLTEDGFTGLKGSGCAPSRPTQRLWEVATSRSGINAQSHPRPALEADCLEHLGRHPRRLLEVSLRRRAGECAFLEHSQLGGVLGRADDE